MNAEYYSMLRFTGNFCNANVIGFAIAKDVPTKSDIDINMFTNTANKRIRLNLIIKWTLSMCLQDVTWI